MKVLRSLFVSLLILWSCAAAQSSPGDMVTVDHAKEWHHINSFDSNPHRDRDTTGDGKAFPCPDAGDISPCVCTVLFEGLEMACSAVTSENQLQEIFLKEFPIKEFYSFYMIYNTDVTTLQANVFNSVSFENITLLNTNLDSVSHYASDSILNTLRHIEIVEGSLTAENFPLNFESYTQLEQVNLQHQQFVWLPHFSSQSLKRLAFSNNMITSLDPGTFDNLPNMEYLDFGHNSLTAIETGTFVLPNGGVTIYTHSNQITDVQAGAFVLPAQTDALTVVISLASNLLITLDEETYGDLFAFVTVIDLFENPLGCGCDVAWIVMNAVNNNKISSDTTCVDGTLFSDLDHSWYMQFC